ncbi:MAG: HAD hydrolase-like protein [Candidatus Sulfotelmatobacter sp.]
MNSRHSSDPAFLFDLDGTLLDTVYVHVAAWSAALKNDSILVPDWKIHRRIGMSGKSLVRQLLREHPKTSKSVDIDRLEKKHDRQFQKLIGTPQLLPGAPVIFQHVVPKK